MASVKKFEDLDVWKLSRELNQKVYQNIIAARPRYTALTYQIDKSAGSVMDNIAEGFGRGGNKEFANFLSISKGSANELKSQLYRAMDRSYISSESFTDLDSLIDLIIKKLGAFISYLKSTEIKGIKYIEEPSVSYEPEHTDTEIQDWLDNSKNK